MPFVADTESEEALFLCNIGCCTCKVRTTPSSDIICEALRPADLQGGPGETSRPSVAPVTLSADIAEEIIGDRHLHLGAASRAPPRDGGDHGGGRFDEGVAVELLPAEQSTASTAGSPKEAISGGRSSVHSSPSPAKVKGLAEPNWASEQSLGDSPSPSLGNADGKAEGHGTLLSPSGTFYEGQFQKGKMHGYGTRKFPGPYASTYRGEWCADLREGQGVQEWDDGSRHEGSYLRGMMCGYGKLTLTSGVHYEGEFQNDEFHGQGSIWYSDGGRYEGCWQWGRPSGEGRHRAPDGTEYEGMFVQGVWHGSGTLVRPNGQRYSGQWVSGKEHGHGMLVQPDGVVLRGIWREGKAVQWIESKRFIQL